MGSVMLEGGADLWSYVAFIKGAAEMILKKAGEQKFKKRDIEQFIQRHGGQVRVLAPAVNAAAQRRSKQEAELKRAKKARQGGGSRKRKRGDGAGQEEEEEEEDEREEEEIPPCFIIAPLGGEGTRKLTDYEKGGNFDCLDPSWLVDCVRRGKVVVPHTAQYRFKSKETQRRMEKDLDRYGDHLWEPTKPDSLWLVLQAIKDFKVRKEGTIPSPSQCRKGMMRALYPPTPHKLSHTARPPPRMRLMQVRSWRRVLRLKDDLELNVAQHRYNLFFSPGSVYYVDCHHLPPGEPSSLDAIEMRLRLYGGQVVEELGVSVTHVVVDRRRPQNFSELANKLRELRKAPGSHLEKRVVDKEWVLVCCEEMCLPLVETAEYEVDIWERRGREVAVADDEEDT